VVDREPVLEAVRSAGVLGHVATDRAYLLARGSVRRRSRPLRLPGVTSRFATPGSTTTRCGKGRPRDQFIRVKARSRSLPPPGCPGEGAAAGDERQPSRADPTIPCTSAVEAGRTRAPASRASQKRPSQL
jgi:hypothetical protein